MSEIHERLVAAFDYLRVKGVIHTQAEFAEAINKSPQQVSDAFKDRPKRCTLGLMNAIAGAYGHYINKEWLLTGNGRMAMPGDDERPHIDSVEAATGTATYLQRYLGADLLSSRHQLH